LLNQSAIGIVSEEDTSEFETMLSSLQTDEGELFTVLHLSKQEATTQLTNDKIIGYYEFDKADIQLFINQNHIEQTVLSEFLSQYLQIQDKVTVLLNAGVNPEEIHAQLIANEDFITESKERSFSQSNFYFFALLGMTILNGFIWGLGNTNDQQANQSANGIRICLSPRNKFVVSFANLLASFVLFYLQSLVVLGVFHFIYRVDFGNNWGWIFLLIAIGSLNALSFGTLMGNFSSKISFDQKITIGTTLTMAMSFLAGMMGTESIKYWISQNLPLLGKINLVNLISEGFYQLYYYQSLQPFYHNLLWLAGFTIVFFLSNVYFERRVSYDHL
jgi:ABC-2 type transport system permease protein